MLNVVLVALLIIYVIFNFITAYLYTAKQMKENFIEEQCVVGCFFANIFYAPAWILKAIRFVVVTAVR